MFDTDLTTLDAPGTIDHMVACRVEAEQLEVAILAAAAHFADLHGTLPAADAGGRVLPGAERLVALGGAGTPEVAEFAPAELAAAIGISHSAAMALIADALDLRHRLPLLWARVSAGEVRAWVGRKVADATRTATADRVASIDGAPSDADAPELPPDPALDGPSPATSFATAAGACPSCLGTPDTDGRTTGPGVTRPGAPWPGLPRTDATLYVHLTDQTLAAGDGIARVEGIGPVLAAQVRAWLQACEARVTVKPVIDVAGQAPVDGYEVPDRLREAVHLLHPADVFPYATNTGRGLDNDHTLPYRHKRRRRPGDRPDHESPPDRDGPPDADGSPDHEIPPDADGSPDIVAAPDEEGPPGGQTRIGNLNKLTRRHHRLKTHGGWQLAQPFPGIWIWRSPHGRHYLVDHTGTTPLGKTA